jgi:hypothetical protein
MKESESEVSKIEESELLCTDCTAVTAYLTTQKTTCGSPAGAGAVCSDTATKARHNPAAMFCTSRRTSQFARSPLAEWHRLIWQVWRHWIHVVNHTPTACVIIWGFWLRKLGLIVHCALPRCSKGCIPPRCCWHDGRPWSGDIIQVILLVGGDEHVQRGQCAGWVGVRTHSQVDWDL